MSPPPEIWLKLAEELKCLLGEDRVDGPNSTVIRGSRIQKSRLFLVTLNSSYPLFPLLLGRFCYLDSLRSLLLKSDWLLIKH